MVYRIVRTCLLLILASGFVAGLVAEETRPAASREAVVRDWMLQDYMQVELPNAGEAEKERWRTEHLAAPESAHEDPVLPSLSCFVSGRKATVERRMLARVLDELESPTEAFRREMQALVEAGAPGRDARWKALYLRACAARREQRLSPLRQRWTQFVFTEHVHIPTSWKYTEVLSDAHSDRQRHFRPGAALKVLDLDRCYGTVSPLIQDSRGMLRNPDVSFDGRRILFAWKKSDRRDDFHLYEWDRDSGTARQLTHGLGFADYEGVYLPDGNILFSSTRCCQTVDCNWVEVSNLYLMDGLGRYVRRVGFDQVHTIFPTVTDDGRVLYTRWEYNDRGQIFPQPLFQMNPDGTNQREFYGGNSWFPTNIIHARKIPGSRKVLAVVTGHHRPAHGKLAVIDPALGRQEGRGVQLIAPCRPADYAQVDRYALQGCQFQYPYPVDERHFLVTLALPTAKGDLGRFDAFFMDVDGRRELLIEGRQAGDRGVGCKQVIPLAPRPRPHVRPSLVDYRQTTGTVFLQDVQHGLGADVAPGTVKRLRVVALEYRAAAIGRLHQEGRGGGSEVTTPVAVGNGSWDVKVVLGTTPVHQDGSAFFEVPARTPIYFQALDEQNRVVQTMRSWTTLMPGENQACVGCHEHKNGTPPALGGVATAMRGGPRPLLPFYGPPRGFSFAREIQPILDRHCLECHNGREEGVVSLAGEEIVVAETKRKFSRSYLALTHTQTDCGDWQHEWVNWIDCMSEPSPLPPYYRGSARSRLVEALEAGHEGVCLSREERDKLACWIDLLVPYCGAYTESHAWTAEEQTFYARAFAKRQRMEALEAANLRALIESQSAASAHGQPIAGHAKLAR